MDKKVVVGVDLGGTTTKLAFVTEEGTILHKWEIATDTSGAGKNILPNIAQSIEERAVTHNITKKQVSSIGIGVPGPVDFESGVVEHCINIGWGKTHVRAYLEERMGVSVFVDNDANIASLGELWKGAGAGTKDLVCMTLGTGIGGGVIVDGKIVHGAKGAGGEIGHVTVIRKGGYVCNCGKTGCLETIASATGIARTAVAYIEKDARESVLKDIDREKKLTAKDVFDAYKQGDALATDIVDEIADHLGAAVANIGNMLNPEKIVIGGGVSAAGDALLQPVTRYFEEYAFSTVRTSTKLALATLGNDAGVVGGAYLAKTYGN
ncbi:ROK family glucokinase [Priestia taiwanensis]|uniref:Glucokinase n=1 Tax=Priestia taiwanensis TaxID=1347902 RepID=A0A917AZF0_9BACI|nr:ROK family glucokinase [Priestia taiwanensis]MBM7365246.1 glucokinase [Priestia taiwanensis]GGE85369.1 glucokinase [Priestia taiwanensis]